MTGEITLQTLLDRAVRGDQEACAALVRHLQPVIRRAVRIHLPLDDPLRRFFDSWDISQSVLVNFLARGGTGAIEFRGPGELRTLLRQMAAQKFIDRMRRAEAACRDWRRDLGASGIANLPDKCPGPEEKAMVRELYQEVRRRFTARERQMADLWLAGHTFPEIAAQVRGIDGKPIRPNAVQMALKRAFARVAGQQLS